MMIFLSVVTVLCLFTTVAPHLPGKHWLIRVWEFPRVQLAFIYTATLLMWMFSYAPYPLLSTFMQLMLLIALGYQLAWVLPYTCIWPKQVKQVDDSNSSDDTLSILTSNVYMPNDNVAGLIDLVEQYQPDILVTLETNKKWERGLRSLEKDYPYRMACPLENLYGMHLFSKKPFSDEKLRFIVESDVPSMEIYLNLAGQPVKVYFVHPKPPSPTENESAAPRDRELKLVGHECAKQTCPVIVTGDLNDVAWSPTTRIFRKISGAQDPRIGRGFFNTFHAKYPIIRWPLDHVFHSKEFELVTIKRLPGYGSDHFPLYTKLKLTGKR
ncbi:endonuclease/exonuclease/phosphatase family protein [Alteromonas sp. C1M14]|uniref:endonuclease/exonuclease/phosphatase family protein n=1 Tax=Alteromonas sp. C1M14 TaxID=2841567 RepID=UPI001C08DF0C|nr:endonuclease/exonuclease/phosphatase family protein [Alteromonas sp. C1M14]MBU2977186.1 endonuclease/exonuclease/phosphatase family protein [Alteromonas sp. C1M14]